MAPSRNKLGGSNVACASRMRSPTMSLHVCTDTDVAYDVPLNVEASTATDHQKETNAAPPKAGDSLTG